MLTGMEFESRQLLFVMHILDVLCHVIGRVEHFSADGAEVLLGALSIVCHISLVDASHVGNQVG